MIFASEASASSGMGGMSMILLMVALIALMYFMMIRPQKKEQKRMQAMLSNLEIGDAVVTQSGFYGVIIDITEEDVIVEFGNNKKLPYSHEKSGYHSGREARRRSCSFGKRLEIHGQKREITRMKQKDCMSGKGNRHAVFARYARRHAFSADRSIAVIGQGFLQNR